MTPMQEIHAERRRQMQVEGWTRLHDDGHDSGEMLHAAVIYYHHAAGEYPLTFRGDGAPMGWPWEAKWWKPKDKHRDLVRAGALCLAERERIRRKPPLPRNWRQGNQTHYTGHVDQKLGLIVDALTKLSAGKSEAKD